MASVERLLLIVDLFLLDKKQALTFNLNIVILLLCWALSQAAPASETTLSTARIISIGAVSVGGAGAGISNVLTLLLLLLLALLCPNLVNIEKLNSDQVAFESSVTVLATANEDICVEETVLGSDISITAVLLVHSQDARDELAVSKQRWKCSLWQIRSEERLALLLLLLATALLLATWHIHHRLAVHLRNLHSLKLVHLKWVKLLTLEHLLWQKSHAALWQLNELWLTIILERADGAHRLADAATSSVTWLEATLLLAKLSHLLLVLWLGRRARDALVSPVALKVAGGTSAMSLATLAAKVVLAGCSALGDGLCWELEVASASHRATCAANGHTLASAVSAHTTTTSDRQVTREDRWCLQLGWLILGRADIGVGVLVLILVLVTSGTSSTWDRKLEAGGSPLLLCHLCRLLGFRNSQGMSTLMATSGRALAAATVGLAIATAGAAKVAESLPRSSTRRRRRRTHVAHVR
jgi:hypothetical protein